MNKINPALISQPVDGGVTSPFHKNELVMRRTSFEYWDDDYLLLAPE